MMRGLTPEEVKIFNTLLNVWHRKLPGNQIKEKYYNQRNALKDLGISIPSKLKNVDTILGWSQKAVDALAERSVFKGFTVNGEEHEGLKRIVEENDFITTYDQATTSELTNSCSFITLSSGEEGEPDVLVNAYTASWAAALWDYRKKRIKSGIAVIDVKEDGYGHIDPIWVNLYLDHATIVCRKASGIWVTWRNENPIGRPLMEPLVYLPTLQKPFGQSRITRTVRAIADSAMREALRTEVSAEFYTAPQKYILGVDPETFGKTEEEREVKKVKAYIGTILALSQNKNGETPSVGQFPQMSMQPHTEYLQSLAKQFAGETGIPLNSLGIVQDNPSSAEAILASTSDLIIKAEKLNRQNGRSLRNVARMALCALNKKTLDELEERDRIDVRFENETRPSMASRADFAVKVAAAVPEYAGTATFWRDLGYDEQDIQQITSELRRNQAQQALVAQLGAPADLTGAENGEGITE